MKILLLADHEDRLLWGSWSDSMRKRLSEVSLVLSAGDLAPEYLEFLVTLLNVPLVYVRGNHDGIYDTRPPEGCINADGRIVEVECRVKDKPLGNTGKETVSIEGNNGSTNGLIRTESAAAGFSRPGQTKSADGFSRPGQTKSADGFRSPDQIELAAGSFSGPGQTKSATAFSGPGQTKTYRTQKVRILGLGGSMRYKPGASDMYTESEMRRRIIPVTGSFLKARISGRDPFDVLLTHAPCRGYGDMSFISHKGFECFNGLLERYKPTLHCYGHVHREYGMDFHRMIEHPSGTTLINACGWYIYDL